MEDKFDESVKSVIHQLARAAVVSFDVAAARYETAERQAGLAQARQLQGSNDPGERALGEQLQARILQGQPLPVDFVVDVHEANGADIDPLSARSSRALPGAASALPALEQGGEATRRGPGRPKKTDADRQLDQNPPRKGPGRPRKSERRPEENG